YPNKLFSVCQHSFLTYMEALRSALQQDAALLVDLHFFLALFRAAWLVYQLLYPLSNTSLLVNFCSALEALD
ncbi:MAG: hypothetical protein AAGU27_26550, partial [Dehalobacterium sp.]